MTHPFHIEQATIRDLDSLVIIFDQYRAFYQQPSNLKEAKAFLYDKFEHRESILFVAKHEETDRIIGFVQLYPSFSSISMKRTWILNDLFVDPFHRQQGVARELLSAAKDYAVHTRSKGLELSTAIDNGTAQKLYEQFGFKRDEEYYHYFLTI
ncbi:GNAT family N-acetyltransferase [Paenibacillus aquistagni]|uniref:Acetyltransferase, GNAT family n=1 Tax=Paenibacillus aquistagni TaxID=1852522 RepID=A0A1X7IZC4_9BACL|nr:GNAT family N-acetyltransferase [Paenibacillus aquistagni]SMG20710.1 Acetyltransferase, GNAT family [Paenibacillus aquistagni]